MRDKSDLIRDFISLGIEPHDTLLVHSSMKSLGEIDGGADTVIDALMEYLKNGLLVFPTHTWRQMNETYNVFDPKTEESCVGLLSNLFLKREGVYRSKHPTHSLAAFGEGAFEFTQGEENMDTPCHRDGCYGKLLQRYAKILFMGCSLNSNTFIHAVEEWCGIPNRIAEKHQELSILMDDGRLLPRPIRRHHNPYCDVSYNYGKIEKPLLELGIAKVGYIAEAKSYLCSSPEMFNIVKRFLMKDEDLFIDDRVIPKEWYQEERNHG